ncbi:hypothetical protein HOLleu_06390 [Holothuria leucospilota]|uniref:Uncharacterized protein n=1 Tax=Holothuria leucospilota TaxID=206669 RepID=A0A9Q1CKU9_HOLLE|nr:hypothetical protein HOLleu_06390 [Holothuria leucospilota]
MLKWMNLEEGSRIQPHLQATTCHGCDFQGIPFWRVAWCGINYLSADVNDHPCKVGSYPGGGQARRDRFTLKLYCTLKVHHILVLSFICLYGSPIRYVFQSHLWEVLKGNMERLWQAC